MWPRAQDEGAHSMRLVTGSCSHQVKIWRCGLAAVHARARLTRCGRCRRRLSEGQGWTCERVLEGHGDWVRDVAWAPSAGIPCNTVASGSEVCCAAGGIPRRCRLNARGGRRRTRRCASGCRRRPGAIGRRLCCRPSAAPCGASAGPSLAPSLRSAPGRLPQRRPPAASPARCAGFCGRPGGDTLEAEPGWRLAVRVPLPLLRCAVATLADMCSTAQQAHLFGGWRGAVTYLRRVECTERYVVSTALVATRSQGGVSDSSSSSCCMVSLFKLAMPSATNQRRGWHLGTQSMVFDCTAAPTAACPWCRHCQVICATLLPPTRHCSNGL